MSARDVTAVVLAGGRSSRFGRDKLVERFAGRTVLDQAIAGVGPLVRETLVVAAPDGPRQVPDGVTLVRDARPFEGPLLGLLAGLHRATQPVVLLVGGDMPTMLPSVLGALIDRLDDPAVEAVLLAHDGGERPLPGAMRVARALPVTECLVAAGERRLRALYLAISTAVIDEPTWRQLDPDGLTLRDVDTPADLP